MRGLHIAVVCIVALALISVLPAPRSRAQGPHPAVATYTVTDLGTLGGAQSKAYGINECGWVVGESQTGLTTSHAFVWSGGSMTDIVPSESVARSINEAGIAAGEKSTGSAFIWSTSSGVVNIASPPGGNASSASDINDSNVVVGTSEINFSNTRGFTWDSTFGPLVINPFTNGSSSSAFGINNAGQVVGAAQVASGQYHAYVLTGTTMTDLGTINGLSSTLSLALAINESGQVVGYSTLSNSLPQTYHAFIWSPGDLQITDLTPLEGNTIANDINNDSQVVGRWGIAPGVFHAFTWTEGTGIVDLNDLTQGSGWILQEATSINDRGQIVGFGISPADSNPSSPHAFLLTPNNVALPPSIVSNVSGNGVYGGTGSLTATLSACGSTPANKNVTFKINGSNIPGTAVTDISGVATLSSVSMTGLNAGSQSVEAIFDGDGSNAAGSASGTLTVSKASQTITVNTHAPASATYNTGFTVAASASLPIIYSSSGGCTNIGAAFTMTSGTTTCTVRYDQPGDSNYNGATQVTETVTAQKATSTTNVTVGNATYDGLAHGGTAVATGAGGLNQSLTVTYTGINGTNYPASNIAPVNAGSYSAAATFDTDSNHTGSSDSKTFTITKANQAITLNTGAPATATYNSQFTVAATADSGLTVAYSSGSPTICTNSGSTFTMISGAGTCVVTYSQSGDDNRNAAQVTENVTAQKATSTTAVSVGNATYDGLPHGGSATVTGTGGLNQSLTVTYTGINGTNYPASNIAPINAGAYSAAATFTTDSNYAGSSDSKTFNIAKANQAITFGALSDKTFGDADFGVSATATTNLAVSFGASGNCSITGSTVHITGAGSCTVTASQAGDSNHNAAPDVPRSFNIAKANQAITFGALSDKTFGDADFGVSATATTNLAVSFGASGNCSIAGSTVHITGAGSCTVTASQAGDSNHNAAPDVSRSFNIAKANQTITFGPLSNKAFADADFGVSATVTSNLAVSFGASGNCSIAGSTVHITGAGSCTITASQAGDGNYNAASNIQQSFSITKATAPITLSNLSQSFDGNPKSVTAGTTPAGLNVSIVYTLNGSPVTPVNLGSYDVSATINDTNYQGSASGTLVIHILAPVLVLEENSLTQLAAMDSVTFVRGPFRVTSFFNFSADHHTRIIFFTSNLGMTQPDATKLAVQAAGIPLTVEAVGPMTGVSGFHGSYVIVRLDDGLPTGDVQVTVTLQGVTSTGGIITIAP